MIKVLIVDDHRFVRVGLAAILGSAGDLVVVGECEDGADVPDAIADVQPDVVLMDVQMPRTNGPEATRILLAQQPSVRVLMLTGAADPAVVKDSAAAGAVGFLVKGGAPQDLIAAVRTVAAGGTVWPATVGSAVESCA